MQRSVRIVTHLYSLLALSPPHQMPYGLQWCIENHAGAGVAHYFADAGAHFGFVAVGRALFAEAFVVSIFAHVEPPVGVGLQLAASGAEVIAAQFAPFIPFFAPTVYFYHQRDCLFLPLNSVDSHLVAFLRKHSTTSMSAGSHSTSPRLSESSHRAPICSLNSICPDKILHIQHSILR